MKTTYIYIALIIVLIVGLVVARNASDRQIVTVTSKYDVFAECISNAGAKFYGAYWCPHCQDQKKLFENSKKLPYIECSTPDGKGQTKVCAEAGVTSYPTWKFADGTTEDGLLQFDKLAEKTNCSVPTE